jgi:hypothetical protein
MDKNFILFGPGPNVIKHLTSVIYKCSQKATVFVRDNPFHSSLMLADKAWSLLKSGVPERCSTEIGSGLTRKF